MEFRFLQPEQFPQLYAAFIDAFSDYVVKMQPSEAGFLDMLTRRGINYHLSIAAFENDQIVAFNINGLDLWQDKLTIYDIGTGVHPQYRGKGLATQLFQFSLLKLRETYAVQYILEVIDINHAAIKTYEKLGFQTVRKLACFKLTDLTKLKSYTPNDYAQNTIQYQQVSLLDWPLVVKFWDWQPSWQNSINSMKRTELTPNIIVAYHDENCVGYGIIFPATGDIPQLAVDKDYRRRGIGREILQRLMATLDNGAMAKMINIDADAIDNLTFCRAMGMETIVDQYEMCWPLS